MNSKSKEIVLGGGCFWCTQAAFDLFKGKWVIRNTPGYAGGHVKNPTYEEVCGGETGHAEVVKVEYDQNEISLGKILEIFFAMHDPTSVNRQGEDVGAQYRSAIFYSDESDRPIIETAIKKYQGGDRHVVTEVKELQEFYPAEDHHKDYYLNNKLQPYCVLVISPKIRKIKKEFGIK